MYKCNTYVIVNVLHFVDCDNVTVDHYIIVIPGHEVVIAGHELVIFAQDVVTRVH